MELLATGVNGNQTNQTFTVHYTDGTSQTFTQNISDWHMPQKYAGESIVLSTPYRNTAGGSRDFGGPFDVYGYSFTLNSAKTVASITLPNDHNVKVFAISVVATVAAPTSLTAKAASTTTVNLSWTAATGTITGYNIYRGTTAGGESLTPINSSPLPATATSYADSTTLPGNTYYYVIKAVNGAGVSPVSNEAKATLPSNGSNTEVDLTGEFNLAGITANGARFSSGLDGHGHALSAATLGTSETWNGVKFNIAPAGSNDVIQATGQTIGLPNDSYSKVDLLATAVNANQPDQTFTVNYTDGTSKSFTQSISDWTTPQKYPGESVAMSTTYRNTSRGSFDHTPVEVYGYSIPVDSTKTIRSITLPDNTNVAILAITLVA